MASAAELVNLIQLGPFIGIDNSDNPEDVPPGYGVIASNVNTHRIHKALENQRGRLQATEFALGTITALQEVVFEQQSPFVSVPVYLATDGVNTRYYRLDTRVEADIPNFDTVLNPIWTQAVQLFGTTYFNNGNSWGGPGTDAFLWMYPPPEDPWYGSYDLNLATASTSTGGYLAQDATAPVEYDYCVTRLVVQGSIPGKETSTTAEAISGTPTSIQVPPPTAATGAGTVSGTPTNADTLTLNVKDAGGNLFSSTITVNGTGVTLATVLNTLVNDYNNGYYGLANPVAVSVNGNGITIVANQSGPPGNAITFELVQTGGHLTVSPTVYTALTGGLGWFVNVGSTEGWNGTGADGSTWTTNLYRRSAIQPTWQFVTNLTGSSTYADHNSDESIANTAILTPRRDPPPPIFPRPFATNEAASFLSYPTPPIAAWQGRTWIFTIAGPSVTGITGQPTDAEYQAQIWFSNAGRPWEFDASQYVILVNDAQTPQFDTSGAVRTLSPYADDPMGLQPAVGNVLIALKRRSMHVVSGDDASNYLDQRVFDIGCCSSESITNALGLIFWASEQGPYMWAGGAPTYIGYQVEQYFNADSGLGYEDLAATTGFYSNMCWYWSFPTQGFTLEFYTIDQSWRYLPYCTQAATFNPYAPEASNQTVVSSGFITLEGGAGYILQEDDTSKIDLEPTDATTNVPLGEIFAARPGTSICDWWFAGGNVDLNQPIPVVWTTAVSGSGEVDLEKEYMLIWLYAPVQAGIVTATLQIDPGVPGAPQPMVVVFDLSRPGASTGASQNKGMVQRAWVNQDRAGGNTGYTAQLTLSFSTVTPQSPVIIYRAGVRGRVRREIQVPS